MPNGPDAAPEGAAPRSETPGEGETRTRGEVVQAPYSVGVVRDDEIYGIRAYEEADKQLRELLRKGDLLDPRAFFRKIAVRRGYLYFRGKMARRAEKLMRENNNPFGEYNLAKSAALGLFSKGEAINADKNREEFEKAQQAGVQTAEFLGSTGEKHEGQTGIEITGPLKDKFEKSILLKIAHGDIKDKAGTQKAILDFVKDKDNIGEEKIKEVFGISASEFGKASNIFASNTFEVGQQMGKDIADGKFNDTEMGRFVKLYFGNIKEGSDTKVKTKVDGVLKRLQSLHLGPLAIGGALANPAVIGAAGALTGFLGARGLGATVGVATAAIPIAGSLSGAGFAAWRAGGEAKEDVAMHARETAAGLTAEPDAKRRADLDKIITKLGRAKSSELINGGGEELLLSGQPRLSIEELKKLPITADQAGEAIEDIPRNREVLKRRRSEIEARLNFGGRNRVDFITYDNITSFKAERLALMKASLEIKKFLQDAGDTDIDKFKVASENKLIANKKEADKAEADYIKARRIRAALVGGAVGFGAGILIHAGISLDEATGRHVAGAIEQVGGAIQHVREQLQNVMSGNKAALPEIPIAGAMSSELATSGGGGKMASLIHETTPTNEPAPLADQQPEVLQTNLPNEIKPVTGPKGEWTKNALNIDERIWEKGNDQFLHTLKKGDAVGLDITRMHEEVQKLVQKGDIGFAFTTADDQTIFVPESSDAVKDGILWLDPNNNKDLVTMPNGNKIPISELHKMIVNGEALAAAKFEDGDIATELTNHREVFNVKFIEAAQMVKDGDKNILHAFATIQGTGNLPADTVEAPVQQPVPQTGAEIPKPTAPGGPEAPKPTQTPGAIPGATETPKPTGTPPIRTDVPTPTPTAAPTAEVKPTLSPAPSTIPSPSHTPIPSAAPGASPRPGLGEIFLSSEPLVPVVGAPRELPEKMREKPRTPEPTPIVPPVPPTAPPAPPPAGVTPPPTPPPTRVEVATPVPKVGPGSTDAELAAAALAAGWTESHGTWISPDGKRMQSFPPFYDDLPPEFQLDKPSAPTPSAPAPAESTTTEAGAAPETPTRPVFEVGTKVVQRDGNDVYEITNIDKDRDRVNLERVGEGGVVRMTLLASQLERLLGVPESPWSYERPAPEPEETAAEIPLVPEAPIASAETVSTEVPTAQPAEPVVEAPAATEAAPVPVVKAPEAVRAEAPAPAEAAVSGPERPVRELPNTPVRVVLTGLSNIYRELREEASEAASLGDDDTYRQKLMEAGQTLAKLDGMVQGVGVDRSKLSEEDISQITRLAQSAKDSVEKRDIGGIASISLGQLEEIIERTSEPAARPVTVTAPEPTAAPQPRRRRALGQAITGLGRKVLRRPSPAEPTPAPVSPPAAEAPVEVPAPEPVATPIEEFGELPAIEVLREGKRRFGEDWNGSISDLRAQLTREAARINAPTLYERDMWGDKAEEMVRLRSLTDEGIREEAKKFGDIDLAQPIANIRFELEQKVAPVLNPEVTQPETPIATIEPEAAPAEAAETVTAEAPVALAPEASSETPEAVVIKIEDEYENRLNITMDRIRKLKSKELHREYERKTGTKWKGNLLELKIALAEAEARRAKPLPKGITEKEIQKLFEENKDAAISRDEAVKILQDRLLLKEAVEKLTKQGLSEEEIEERLRKG